MNSDRPPRLDNATNPWNIIFLKHGHVFRELLPAYHELLAQFRARGVQRVLDLGCGSGRHTVALAKAGFELTAIDLAPEGLRLTRAWLADEGLAADLLRADFRRPFPLRDGYYDGLISTQVIHHSLLAGVLNAIREIYRVLAPGGLAFVSVAGRIHGDETYEEIELGTFLPLDGDEAGLPHHIFTLDKLARAFGAFHILDIGPRDNGRVLAVLAEKPAA